VHKGDDDGDDDNMKKMMMMMIIIIIIIIIIYCPVPYNAQSQTSLQQSCSAFYVVRATSAQYGLYAVSFFWTRKEG